ncbi:MAG: hypothetical protein LC646_10865 [Xanthomonadaceae bacterium]|nr:hypothetical protein [Xanthomonadaceae bacterium]
MSRSDPRHPQSGAATLATALVLLIATTVMSFALARTSLLEQRILQNELHATEALQRAEALLERGMLSLHYHGIPTTGWQPGGPNQESIRLGASGLVLPAASSGEGYQYELQLQRNILEPGYLELDASAASDSGIQARVRQYVQAQPGLSRELPPLLLDGCLAGAGGGIQFFPPRQVPVALATTQSNSSGGCIDASFLHLQGGYIEDQHPGAGQLWEALFEIGKTEHRQRSEQERLAVQAGELAPHERTYYWVDDSNRQWPDQFGSPSHPVWIVFSAAAQCPDLPDGLTIHGIVYYETGLSGQCDASGWGQISLHGSLLVEGDLVNLAGGGHYHHYEHAHPDGLAAHLKPLRVARIPGTWRDF